MQGLVATLLPSHANCADNLRARSRERKSFVRAVGSRDAQRGVSLSPIALNRGVVVRRGQFSDTSLPRKPTHVVSEMDWDGTNEEASSRAWTASANLARVLTLAVSAQGWVFKAALNPRGHARRSLFAPPSSRRLARNLEPAQDSSLASRPNR